MDGELSWESLMGRSATDLGNMGSFEDSFTFDAQSLSPPVTEGTSSDSDHDPDAEDDWSNHPLQQQVHDFPKWKYENRVMHISYDDTLCKETSIAVDLTTTLESKIHCVHSRIAAVFVKAMRFFTILAEVPSVDKYHKVVIHFVNKDKDALFVFLKKLMTIKAWAKDLGDKYPVAYDPGELYTKKFCLLTVQLWNLLEKIKNQFADFQEQQNTFWVLKHGDGQTINHLCQNILVRYSQVRIIGILDDINEQERKQYEEEQKAKKEEQKNEDAAE